MEKYIDIISPAEIEELNTKVQFLNLNNGRRVAFFEYGDPKGKPILFFHGTGSHVHAMLLHQPCHSLGFRLIVPDRPGIGFSDFQPERTLLQATEDMKRLVNQLGIEKFIAMGVSGGGPSLMAAAYAMPERVERVFDLACAVPLYRDKAALKSLGTMDRFYAETGSRLPLAAFQIPFFMLKLATKNPWIFAKMMASSMGASDTKLFLNKNLRYLFVHDFKELFRQGTRGAAYDAQLVYRDWGFSLSGIKVPIEIFHGSEDRWVPFSFSVYLAKQAPDARLHLLEGEGHFCHLVFGEELMRKVQAASE